jgi:hypothetical protein
MASAAAFDLPPPPPLRRTCATPTCNEHCVQCRGNDRIAAEMQAEGFWLKLAGTMHGSLPLTTMLPQGGGALAPQPVGAAAGAGGGAAADDDDDYAWVAALEAAPPASPPCYLHGVALHPTATACVAVYNDNHMDSCMDCKYYNIKRINSPGVKWYARGSEIFVVSWG